MLESAAIFAQHVARLPIPDLRPVSASDQLGMTVSDRAEKIIDVQHADARVDMPNRFLEPEIADDSGQSIRRVGIIAAEWLDVNILVSFNSISESDLIEYWRTLAGCEKIDACDSGNCLPRPN